MLNNNLHMPIRNTGSLPNDAIWRLSSACAVKTPPPSAEKKQSWLQYLAYQHICVCLGRCWGASNAQAKGNGQVIASFGKNLVWHLWLPLTLKAKLYIQVSSLTYSTTLELPHSTHLFLLLLSPLPKHITYIITLWHISLLKIQIKFSEIYASINPLQILLYPAF